MLLESKEVKRVGIVIAIVTTCVILSWTSTYFLGDDNEVEEDLEIMEQSIIEYEFHASPDKAREEVEMISPKKKVDKNHS